MTTSFLFTTLRLLNCLLNENGSGYQDPKEIGLLGAAKLAVHFLDIPQYFLGKFSEPVISGRMWRISGGFVSYLWWIVVGLEEMYSVVVSAVCQRRLSQ